MTVRPIQALVALDPGADRDLMQAALNLEPHVETVGVADEASSWAALKGRRADVLVVACGDASENTLGLIAEAATEHPERPIVVLYAGSPNGFVPRVFGAGADDIVSVVPGPDGEMAAASQQVLFSLQKAVARKRGHAARSDSTNASMICVLGPKGGTGKTLTTVNLAIALAQAGNRVAILDLDLQFGDVGLAMGLRPERTMYDLATSSGSLDTEKLEAFLVQHESGARALLAPVRPDQASAVSGEFIREVSGLLRERHDYVLVDTPPGFTPEVIASIDASTDVCIVGTLDSLSLKNLKLGLETLTLMGYDPERVSVVLNRADSRVGISREDASTIIGMQPDVFVPSHRDVARSMNEGTPIVLANPRADAARAYAVLARKYAAAAQPESSNGHRNGRRLFGRGS
jgi:pilus assembly protein CpaE